MFRYPYFGMPYYNRYSRYGYRYPAYNGAYKNGSFYSNKFENKKEKIENTVCSSNKPKCNSFDGSKDNACVDNNTDSPLFRLFGIDLYFDDILLVCLILFLYDEGVEDEWLYIVLVLLLLG